MLYEVITVVAVGQRDAGVSRGRQPGSDSRHDLERDSCFGEKTGFLTTTAEDEGIATLEANDRSPGAGMPGQQGIDLLLRQAVTSLVLADVDP